MMNLTAATILDKDTDREQEMMQCLDDKCLFVIQDKNWKM